MITNSSSPGALNCNRDSSAMNDRARDSTHQQVCAPSSSYLEARLSNLEDAYNDLRGDLDTLRDDLCRSFGKVKPQHPDMDLVKSRQSAMQFKQELDQLIRGARTSHNGEADTQKADGNRRLEVNVSVPPHMRAASVASQGSGHGSLPPHLRRVNPSSACSGDIAAKLSLDTAKHKHDPLLTDGPVDTIVRQSAVPAAAPSPPLSPSTTIQGDALRVATETLSLDDWKPYYLTTLAPLSTEARAKIPPMQKMVTFTFDMLQNTFGGIAWSPGLRYINTTGAPLLRNRTYYLLDPKYEPYLPKEAGAHGAKLTAFFNKAPEEEFDNLPEGTTSYTDVPMFVQVAKGRYAYYGNYSQTRWSDKLDNDAMKARVPQEVKEHIAKDLATNPRETWVTRELQKHFFPKPEYEGVVAAPSSDHTTINTADEDKHNNQVVSDVKEYIEQLTEWERDANMKTAMIKPDFILDAFDAADADDPPALRLWWEYLECVDWKLDFYNMLVGFQARADNPK